MPFNKNKNKLFIFYVRKFIVYLLYWPTSVNQGLCPLTLRYNLIHKLVSTASKNNRWYNHKCGSLPGHASTSPYKRPFDRRKSKDWSGSSALYPVCHHGSVKVVFRQNPVYALLCEISVWFFFFFFYRSNFTRSSRTHFSVFIRRNRQKGISLTFKEN